MSISLLNRPLSADLTSDNIEREILVQIEEQEVISLDTLIELLPDYNWSQIFQTVDGLARSGKVVLRRHRFEYTLFSIHYAA